MIRPPGQIITERPPEIITSQDSNFPRVTSQAAPTIACPNPRIRAPVPCDSGPPWRSPPSARGEIASVFILERVASKDQRPRSPRHPHTRGSTAFGRRCILALLDPSDRTPSVSPRFVVPRASGRGAAFHFRVLPILGVSRHPPTVHCDSCETIAWYGQARSAFTRTRERGLRPD